MLIEKTFQRQQQHGSQIRRISDLPTIARVVQKTHKVKLNFVRKYRVLYARKGGEDVQSQAVNLGGDKISVEEATTLKSICWGGPNIVPRPEWIKTGVEFHPPEVTNAYGLKAIKGATKSFQLILEAYILKHLLFESKQTKRATKNREGKKNSTGEKPYGDRSDVYGVAARMHPMLRPNEMIQRDILAGAISDLLWKVGGQTKAVVAIPEANPVFEAPVRFSIDGITEKLHLFNCSKEEELKNIIKRHIYFFMQEKGGGMACLLYSVVLSAGWDKLKEDMQDQGDMPLIDTEDKISLCLSNLMLTGSAVPFLHNGIMSADVNDATNFEYGDGKVGITGRNEIGFLLWDTNEETTQEANVGSRLKTPVLPIWVTCINDNWGVLFNPNKDLMKSYSAENRFYLFYYSSFIQQNTKDPKDTLLIVDTRGVKVKGSLSEMDEDFDEMEEDPLASAIQTKWEGAAVSWDSVLPYV